MGGKASGEGAGGELRIADCGSRIARSDLFVPCLPFLPSGRQRGARQHPEACSAITYRRYRKLPCRQISADGYVPHAVELVFMGRPGWGAFLFSPEAGPIADGPLAQRDARRRRCAPGKAAPFLRRFPQPGNDGSIGLRLGHRPEILHPVHHQRAEFLLSQNICLDMPGRVAKMNTPTFQSVNVGVFFF